MIKRKWCVAPWGPFHYKEHLCQVKLNIRYLWDCILYIMGISVLVNWHICIELAPPWCCFIAGYPSNPHLKPDFHEICLLITSIEVAQPFRCGSVIALLCPEYQDHQVAEKYEQRSVMSKEVFMILEFKMNFGWYSILEQPLVIALLDYFSTHISHNHAVVVCWCYFSLRYLVHTDIFSWMNYIGTNLLALCQMLLYSYRGPAVQMETH